MNTPITRRKALRTLFGSTATIALFGFCSRAFGAEEKLTPELLKKKLYAKTKAEEAFIDYIFQLRKANKISEKTLYAAYRYSLQQRSRRFITFKTAITKLAKNEGVKL